MAKDYGAFHKGDNATSIQTGNAFKTSDVSGTPKTSPYSLTSSETAFSIPTNAAEMVMVASGNMDMSEVAGMATYATIASGTMFAVGVADTDTIYLKGSSGTVTLNFWFVLV